MIAGAEDIATECARQLLCDADRLRLALRHLDEAAAVCALAGEPGLRGYATAVARRTARRIEEIEGMTNDESTNDE